MSKKILFLAMILAVGACGYQHRPIYSADDPMPNWTQKLPPQRVEDLIAGACLGLGWKTQHVAEGHLTATQARQDYSATVDILFDRQHWQIRYADSVGLRYDGETIHDHYNLWVRTLEREIQNRFSAALTVSGQ